MNQLLEQRDFNMEAMTATMQRLTDTAGKNTAAIKAYIANQLKVDRETDHLSLFDPQNPFTGSR